MGCMASKKAMMETYREEHMPLAKQMASNPRQLSNGNTFIPVNYIDGKYPIQYPQWLKHHISASQYANIIQQLNKLNKSSLVWNEKRMLTYSKLPRQKAKLLIEKDKKQFNDDMDRLLLQINNKILISLSLNMTSTLRKVHVKPCEMGVIISHININPGLGIISPKSDGGLVILSTYEHDNICNSNRKNDTIYSPNN